MEQATGLGDALHLLGSATDLDQSLSDLLSDLRRASPSTSGLEVHTVVAGQHVRLVRFLPGVRPEDVTTSLEVPLPSAVRVIFYGTRPGAFVDLAADLAHGLGLTLADLALDRHRPSSTLTGSRGLDRAAIVHQAVGVLIAQDHHPDEAYAELVARSLARGISLVDQAQAVVDAAVAAADEPG